MIGEWVQWSYFAIHVLCDPHYASTSTDMPFHGMDKGQFNYLHFLSISHHLPIVPASDHRGTFCLPNPTILLGP